LNFTNTLSFSVWAKFLLGGTHNPRVFHKDENFTGYQLYTPGLASGRQFNFTVYLEGVGYVSVESTGGYSSGVWHHIAGTFDGVELKLYVNGMLVGTTAAVGSIAQTDVPLAIGRNSNQATDHWRGDIDELRLYNRALSEEEVAVLYLLQQ
jgi:beta-galactosidase